MPPIRAACVRLGDENHARAIPEDKLDPVGRYCVIVHPSLRSRAASSFQPAADPRGFWAFAAAMMVGVGLTLAAVAALTVLARDWVVALTARHGASIERLGRGLDGLAGVLLVVIGLRELVR